MSMRLLCETAATSTAGGMQGYVKANFANAKKGLTQNLRTTLANQNVTESTLVQLLHTGAHNYATSSNIDQTMAISIILGEMIKISHGK